MEKLFTALTKAVEGTPMIAMCAAFLWGILSILLSPCHLSSIPLIVGFIDTQSSITTKRAFIISLLFSVGILITIACIGVITAAAGRMMGDIGKYGNYVVAIIFFLVGLYLLDVIQIPLPGAGQVGMKRKGCWLRLYSALFSASPWDPVLSHIWRRCWQLRSSLHLRNFFTGFCCCYFTASATAR